VPHPALQRENEKILLKIYRLKRGPYVLKFCHPTKNLRTDTITCSAPAGSVMHSTAAAHPAGSTNTRNAEKNTPFCPSRVLKPAKAIHSQIAVTLGKSTMQLLKTSHKRLQVGSVLRVKLGRISFWSARGYFLYFI